MSKNLSKISKNYPKYVLARRLQYIYLADGLARNGQYLWLTNVVARRGQYLCLANVLPRREEFFAWLMSCLEEKSSLPG